MSETNPKFTILIPVVKTLYFNEALESALAQTFPDYEIVVLDNKADADLSWVAEKPKTRLVQNEFQLPPAPNWSKGIENSRGDYIVLLCDDDVLAPECLAEIDVFLARQNYNLDVVRFLRKEFWKDRRDWIGSFSCPGKEVETVDEYIYFQFKYFRGQALSDFVFNRKAALEIGGVPEMPGSFASDKALVLALGAIKNKIGNINLPLLNYRWHATNYTNSRRPSLFEDSLDSDFAFYRMAQQLLEKSTGPCAKLAQGQNTRYWQIRQNTHFNDALRVFGWRGLWRILKHAPSAPDSPASKKKSFWLAVANWLRRIVTRK
jgi:glycosyltransferase involved in cell wall biosynthesis